MHRGHGGEIIGREKLGHHRQLLHPDAVLAGDAASQADALVEDLVAGLQGATDLIGVLLDWRSHLASAGLYTVDGFRIAFAVQYLVVGIGVVFLVIARRRTRRRLLDDEGIEVGPLWVALVARWNRGRP